MNLPFKPDDERHIKAVKAGAHAVWQQTNGYPSTTQSDNAKIAITAYFASLEEQGVKLADVVEVRNAIADRAAVIASSANPGDILLAQAFAQAAYLIDSRWLHAEHETSPTTTVGPRCPCGKMSRERCKGTPQDEKLLPCNPVIDQSPCKECGGTGKIRGRHPLIENTCSDCKGSGKKFNDDEAAMGYVTPPCKSCGGTGDQVEYRLSKDHVAEDITRTCPRCNGSGKATMVDLYEVVEALREPLQCRQPSSADVAAAGAWHGAADFIERRFAPEG